MYVEAACASLTAVDAAQISRSHAGSACAESMLSVEVGNAAEHGEQDGWHEFRLYNVAATVPGRSLFCHKCVKAYPVTPARTAIGAYRVLLLTPLNLYTASWSMPTSIAQPSRSTPSAERVFQCAPGK